MEYTEEIIDAKTRLTLLEKKMDALIDALANEGIVRKDDIEKAL